MSQEIDLIKLEMVNRLTKEWQRLKDDLYEKEYLTSINSGFERQYLELLAKFHHEEFKYKALEDDISLDKRKLQQIKNKANKSFYDKIAKTHREAYLKLQIIEQMLFNLGQ